MRCLTAIDAAILACLGNEPQLPKHIRDTIAGDGVETTAGYIDERLLALRKELPRGALERYPKQGWRLLRIEAVDAAIERAWSVTN